TPDDPLLVSEISLWEVASLQERGKLRLDVPVRDWLEEATAAPLVHRVGISPSIAAESTLPATRGWDPADRIVVATARVLGATLLTQDARMIQSGLVRTI